MRRALIITSAGCSTRFSSSLGREVLKVLYTEGKPKETLLSEQLALAGQAAFDRVVIVGGYRFAELNAFIASHHGDCTVITTVYNDKFREYGTCYSFACGLKALEGCDLDEVVFMEGDLFFDLSSFMAVVASDFDVVTANRNLVRADSAVIFYTTTCGQLCYAYDIRHTSLQVDEPFTMLGNSGQVWKFRDVKLLHETLNTLGADLYDDTNLVPVARYFTARGIDNIEFIIFDVWFNCNTISDYRDIRSHRRGYEKRK